MDITEEFNGQLRDATAADSYRPIFLPEVLVRICVRILPIDGASLSLHSDELRMPLAASDEQARAAELIQFTLGDGPCLETYRTRQPQSLTYSDLLTRWPVYLDGITDATDYRSVTSLPLSLGDGLYGALDLYLNGPDAMALAALDDASEVAALMAQALRTSPHGQDGAGSGWLDSPGIHQRATAWIAIGLIARAADLTAIDALDLVRAYAWQLGQTVDDISYELASHTLLAQQLLDELRPSTSD